MSRGGYRIGMKTNKPLCGRKRRYADEFEAQRVAKHAMQVRQVQLRLYDCPRCKGWHLTHKT